MNDTYEELKLPYIQRKLARKMELNDTYEELKLPLSLRVGSNPA